MVSGLTPMLLASNSAWFSQVSSMYRPAVDFSLVMVSPQRAFISAVHTPVGTIGWLPVLGAAGALGAVRPCRHGDQALTSHWRTLFLWPVVQARVSELYVIWRGTMWSTSSVDGSSM